MLSSWAIAAIVWGLFVVGVVALVLARRSSLRRPATPAEETTVESPDGLAGRDRYPD